MLELHQLRRRGNTAEVVRGNKNSCRWQQGVDEAVRLEGESICFRYLGIVRELQRSCSAYEVIHSDLAEVGVKKKE